MQRSPHSTSASTRTSSASRRPGTRQPSGAEPPSTSFLPSPPSTPGAQQLASASTLGSDRVNRKRLGACPSPSTAGGPVSLRSPGSGCLLSSTLLPARTALAACPGVPSHLPRSRAEEDLELDTRASCICAVLASALTALAPQWRSPISIGRVSKLGAAGGSGLRPTSLLHNGDCWVLGDMATAHRHLHFSQLSTAAPSIIRRPCQQVGPLSCQQLPSLGAGQWTL